MKRQVLDYLGRIIKITPAKPKAAANGAQPKPIKPEGPQETSTIEVTTLSSAKNQQTLNSEQSSGAAGSVDSATPQADPKEDPFTAALQAKKNVLKPTEVSGEDTTLW